MEELPENPLKNLPRRKVLWLLFFHFLKIATFVVGGGYAIILAAERIFVERLKWLSEQELFDGTALFQTVPGLMAGNTAVYIGYRAAGYPGALAALAGVALPSFVIITLIALGFSALPLDNVYVQGAFVGARSALGGLTLAAIIKLWKSSKVDLFWFIIAFGCLAGVLLSSLNPAWFLLAGAVAGTARSYWRMIFELKHRRES